MLLDYNRSEQIAPADVNGSSCAERNKIIHLYIVLNAQIMIKCKHHAGQHHRPNGSTANYKQRMTNKMEWITPRLASWASILETQAQLAAERTSRLPVVAGHVALMPDAHHGIGSTVGSVIPTDGAIIPAAVGVDIGCGMVGVFTDLSAEHLPDDLGNLLGLVEQAIPAGLGEWHAKASRAAERWFAAHPPPRALGKLADRAMQQFGSLGGGNHFVEVCLDENDRVWLVLHSGSRGVGNQLGRQHIDRAKQMARDLELGLEDPDLAYFTQDTTEFSDYIADMLWCQAYAAANRDAMMDRLMEAVIKTMRRGRELDRINCHHNFAQLEDHDGRQLWITRKGAIQADQGMRGIIPGSMGAATYIVQGLGNSLSWRSCSHGAGRIMSRGAARRTIEVQQLRQQMEGRTWQEGNAGQLLDEAPGAYKPIDQVMADQQDLVGIQHTLHQVLNYKGVESGHRKR